MTKPTKYKCKERYGHIHVDQKWHLRPPKTTDELVKMMEDVLPVGVSSYRHHSVTGEKYVEYKYYVSDEEAANANLTMGELLCLKAWEGFLLNYAKSNKDGNKLYWRAKPTTEGVPNSDKVELFMWYLISDKPAHCRRLDSFESSEEFVRYVRGE